MIHFQLNVKAFFVIKATIFREVLLSLVFRKDGGTGMIETLEIFSTDGTSPSFWVPLVIVI